MRLRYCMYKLSNKELVTKKNINMATETISHSKDCECCEKQFDNFIYTNGYKEYPDNLFKIIEWSVLTNSEFFVGICSFCYTDYEILHRCSGCQLVAYCSKPCQKKHWIMHKPICKQFALKNGLNALSEIQKLKNDARKLAMNEMKLKALQAVRNHFSSDCTEEEIKSHYLDYVHGMFEWPRVCNKCKNARNDQLTNCICHTVSYCSGGHRKADKDHRRECYDLQVYARTICYLQLNDTELFLPIANEVKEEYQPLKSMEEFHLSPIDDEWLDAKLAILSERLSSPLTILYAMQESGIGTNKIPVESVTSLNIHVVSPRPMLDSRMWEMLVHRLPQLNELNISFIAHDMALANRLNIDIVNRLERCADCKSRNRLITYNIHLEHYHMYFSSMEYNEPDVIALFTYIESSPNEDDNVHDVTSYRNMTYNENTLIVLTDSEIDEMARGTYIINEARPVDWVMKAKLNPFRGFSSLRGIQGDHILNYKKYMACFRRK